MQDVISGDEMISDSFDLKLVDGAVYEVDCARITIGNDNIGTPASFHNSLATGTNKTFCRHRCQPLC